MGIEGARLPVGVVGFSYARVHFISSCHCRGCPEHQKIKAMSITESPSHVALRVKSEEGETIQAHIRALNDHSSAMFGKVGQPLGIGLMDELNKQVKAGTDTYLFLALRDGWNGPYVIFQCSIVAVSRTLPDAKAGLVPDYYNLHGLSPTTWFEITSFQLLSREQSLKVIVKSSDRQIINVLNSSASMFRVALQD